jgi:tape measure domain-containing protein
MATNSRDVTLKLSVETLGQDGIQELQKAVAALGKDGSAAAPEFQRLADEIGRLGEQSQALTTFRELSEATDQLVAKQAESAQSTAQMAERLDVLRDATAQARDRQREATQALIDGQVAQQKAKGALKLLKEGHDAAGKSIQAYRDELKPLVAEQTAANVALVTLRAQQKAANAEVAEAERAQKKLETQYTRSVAGAKRLDDALQAQTDALRAAVSAAEELGVSTTDVATAEGRLLAAFQSVASEVEQVQSSFADLASAQERQTRATEEQAAATRESERALETMTQEMQDEFALIQQVTAGQEQLTRAINERAAAERDAAQAAERASAAAVEMAEHNRLLAIEQASLNRLRQQGEDALNAEVAAIREAGQAANLYSAAKKQQAQAERETATAAQEAAQKIDTAFATLGVRSIEAVQRELVQTKAAMATLGEQSASTGQRLSGAFAAGESKIKALEREVRELSGSLTFADKAAGLFRNSMGQIAAGNLIADAIGWMVEKVKEMGREFVRSVVQLDTFRRAMNAVYKDTSTTAKQLDFLRKTATESGVSVGGISDSFVKFSASMKSANVPLAESNALFKSVTRAAGTLGLSGERTTLMLDALAQMASKGVVSMEELRQQLGDSLPGALSLTAKGLGITDATLVKLVESGNLATRDFIPAFTRGLKELHGETEGLVPTWERLKNSLTIAAQNAGDAGGIEIMATALKGLAAAAALVILPLNKVFETTGTLGRSFGVLVGAAATLTNPIQALNDLWNESAERQRKLSDAFKQTILGADASATAAGEAARAMTAEIVATEGLTRSQQALALATKLAGDNTFDAGSKYVQLAAFVAQAMDAQNKETEALGKLSKAAKDQGETLVELARTRGEEQGVMKAGVDAANLYSVALAKVATSQAEETRLLEAQKAALIVSLEQRKLAPDVIAKETAEIDKKITTSKAETEQALQAAAAAKQEADSRKLAAEMYGNQATQAEALREKMESLKKTLADYEKLNQHGRKTDEEVKNVRQQLAEITAKYRDALNDSVAVLRLEADATLSNLKAKQSTLSMDVQIAQTSANIAKLRGNNALAMSYEREAMQKQIEVSKIKLEIDRIEAQVAIEKLKVDKQLLDVNDANYKMQLKQIELKIKLQEITLRELGETGKLLKLKEEENRLTQAAAGNLGAEAGARGAVTDASEKQADALAKIMMQYTLSANYTERQIALLEKEAAAEEKLAEARRKRLKVDKDGFSTDESGNRISMGGDLTTLTGISSFLKSAGVDDDATAKAIAKEFSDGKGNIPYFPNPGQMKYGGASSTMSEALLKAAERYTFGGGAARSKDAAAAGTQTTSTAAPTATDSSTNKTVTINIGGRSQKVNVNSDADAQNLTSILRQLETQANTAS